MPNVQPVKTLGAVPSATQANVWTFSFGPTFDRAILSTATLNFELELDTFKTFASPNLRRWTRTSAGLPGFQNGAIGKAFEARLPGPADQTDVTWYWRARVNSGTFLSPWSETRSLLVRGKTDLKLAAGSFADLASEPMYPKEAKSTNVYRLLLQAARETDLLDLEAKFTEGDLILDAARDTAVTNNFSRALALERVASEPAAHHRWKTTKLWKAFANLAGSEQAIIDAVAAFVAEPPTILDLTTTQGWILPFHFIKVPSNPSIKPIITIYSRRQKGHSWVLTIFNSWALNYDRKVLESFVNQLKPSHSEVTFTYSSNRHWSLRYDRTADWALWTNNGNVDTTSLDGAIQLSSGTTSGVLTSPMELISGASGYDAPEFTQVRYGQTITVEARTSPNGSNFGAYAQIYHGVEPGTELSIQPYIQFRITLSRDSAGAASPVLSKLEFRGVRI